jgi:hypothetical protein
MWSPSEDPYQSKTGIRALNRIGEGNLRFVKNLTLPSLLSLKLHRRQPCRSEKWLISTTVRLVLAFPLLIAYHIVWMFSRNRCILAWAWSHHEAQRMRITHELITAYDMLDKMHIIVSSENDNIHNSKRIRITLAAEERCSPENMTWFHTDEYVHFLQTVTPETAEKMTIHGTRCMSVLASAMR